MGAWIVTPSVLDLLVNQWTLWVGAAWTTCSIVLRSTALSLTLGGLLGYVLSRQCSWKLTKKVAAGVAFVLRAVPFYVQLSAAYFAIPQLSPIHWDAITAAWVALGVCSSGYVSQLISGCLDQVGRSQWETAMVLGYSRWQTLRHVIAPQLLQAALPGIANELDSMVKSTAVLSTIGIVELTRMGQNTVSKTLDPAPTYLLLAVLYCLLSVGLRAIVRTLQRRGCYVGV